MATGRIPSPTPLGMHASGIAATLVIAILTLGALAVFGLPGTRLPDFAGSGTSVRIGRTLPDLATLPGFQRRGEVVIGEVRDSAGQTLRLVFDAHSHVLLGLGRVNSPLPTPPNSASPLPEQATPAN